MKEVKSKVYKAVKGKDGKCVLVKKRRVKPKKKIGVKKKSKPVVPIPQKFKEKEEEKEKPKTRRKKPTGFDLFVEAVTLGSTLSTKNKSKTQAQEGVPVKEQNIQFGIPEGFPTKGGKKPLPVRIVPDPVPPLTEFQMLRNQKLARKQKLEKDKKERYDRNVALNSKDSQQGLVLGEKGMLSGKGVEEDGTYDYQIEKIMKKFPAFKGVIAADEIDSLPTDNKVAFVMNTAERNEEGEHWVSGIIDASHKVRSVMYFDPFGKQASRQTRASLKKLVGKMNPETMLLYKWNKVKQQDVSTNTCGLHAMNFLMKMLNGKSFIEATGYSPKKPKDQSKKFEAEVGRKFSELM